jgi:hypothetical protein
MGPAFLPDALWLARGVVLLDTYDFLDQRPAGRLDETGANHAQAHRQSQGQQKQKIQRTTAPV